MIFTHLDLSTEYLERSTMDLLTTNPDWPMTIANYPEGVFVRVPSEDYCDEAHYPADLVMVFNYARSHGVHIIRFDADGGDDCYSLPTYDWT